MTSCAWCDRDLPATITREVLGVVSVVSYPSRFCGKECRQAAFRARRRGERVTTAPASEANARFAYADPPYLGKATRYYGGPEDPFEGVVAEVDHAELIGRLEWRRTTGELRGWALSCSTASLATILRLEDGAGAFLVPPEHRIATWVKPGGIPVATYGIHAKTEKVIVVGGRRAQPGVPDYLIAHAARLGGSELPGRKPIAFCAWLFDLLGMIRSDDFDDLFPGTGQVGRAWREVSTAPKPPAERGRRSLFSSLVDGRHADAASLAPGADAPSLLENATPPGAP